MDAPLVELEMSPKNACFCLTLVLVTTWADRLKTGAFFVTPRWGTTAFGQEVYPYSIRERAETRETIEAPPLARINQEPLSIALVLPRIVCSTLEAAVSHMFSGADACYLFMSIQR
jgi:hypothetical protein